MMKSTIVGIISGHRSCFWRLSLQLLSSFLTGIELWTLHLCWVLRGVGNYGIIDPCFSSLALEVRTAAPRREKIARKLLPKRLTIARERQDLISAKSSHVSGNIFCFSLSLSIYEWKMSSWSRSGFWLLICGSLYHYTTIRFPNFL